MLSQINLTVLFNDPFWIGIFEVIEDDEYKVCKVTFGPEPKVEETYELILNKFYSLNFSNPISSDKDPLIEKKNKIQKDYKERFKKKLLQKE